MASGHRLRCVPKRYRGFVAGHQRQTPDSRPRRPHATCTIRLLGEVSEWLKEHAWKACVPKRYRGFESPLSAARSPRPPLIPPSPPNTSSPLRSCPATAPRSNRPELLVFGLGFKEDWVGPRRRLSTGQREPHRPCAPLPCRPEARPRAPGPGARGGTKEWRAASPGDR